MSDELPTAARIADPGIRALYRLENRWQAWLDVEAALARLQKVEGRQLRILICGSLYLAGHVLALQEGVQAQMN